MFSTAVHVTESLLKTWGKSRLKLPYLVTIDFSRKKSSAAAENKKWESVVGLEVHAQIKSNSKLFSGAASDFGSPVNSLVSLFDCAIPGTLPVLNKRAVEAALSTALALNCQVNLVSEFDRKHYFYADMPAGYQITQQRLPLANNGHLNFVVYSPAVHAKPYKMQSKIKQLQLEQDSGKSMHDEVASGSLIDLNRAGVGLMEIVFEPDLRDGEEAYALVNELISILETLDTCSCKMEEGCLRVDANVSVNRPGESFGTRTEIKNLNSLRTVTRSINYEINRQIQILESGGKIINETRSFDPVLKSTVSMRDKEEKQDYRYMPEPNLPPLRLTNLNLEPSKFISRIPTLPEDERSHLIKQYQLDLKTVLQLMGGGSHKFFKQVMELNPKLSPKRVSSLLLTDLLALLNDCGGKIDNCPVRPETFSEIVTLLDSRMISHSTAQQLLNLVYKGDLRSPSKIVEEEDWIMVTDEKEISAICNKVISENEKAVTAYRSGKTKVFGSLTSQVKRVSKNKVDMVLAVEILTKILQNKKS